MPRAVGRSVHSARAQAPNLQLHGNLAARGREDYKTSWSKPSFFDRDALKSEPHTKFNHDDMKGDENRTPLYFAAIRERLRQAGPGVLTVLDLGTGPFALMALEAARAGAKRVYAIEADVANAQLAREAVAAAGFADVVEIIDGLSTRVTLPEKVDVLISEIVGSVASEEGLYATIADAHERHVKHPTEPQSWIPHRCQTLGAPASYAMQIGRGHPAFVWLDRFRRSQNSSVVARLRCDDETLMMLAPPAVLEDVKFTDPKTLLRTGHHALMRESTTFHIDESRLSAVEAELRALLSAGGAAAVDLDIFAPFVARSLSGIGMWPRLELDPDAKFVVEARGKDGAYQSSSWRTLVLFASDQPVPIAHGSSVTARLHVELSQAISGKEADEPQYTLDTSVNGIPDMETMKDEFLGLLYRLADPLRRVYLRNIWESIGPAEKGALLSYIAITTLASRILHFIQ